MRNQYRTYGIAGIISLLTVFVYLRALRNDFVDWDDNQYIIDNSHIRSLDASFFKWAFLEFHSANWHPLTWVSHAVDVAVWGLNPLGHHLTSILLHGVNAFLVTLVATMLLKTWCERRQPGEAGFLDRQGILIAAGVTGILFGIHPLHVESVAWVAERKDVLCGMFFLLSILAYLRAVNTADAQQGQPGSSRFPRKDLVVCGVFFIFALLSKPMAVTLPVVLLILDWQPLRRITSIASLQAQALGKAPLFLLSIASAIVTVHAQRAGDTIVPLEYFPMGTRVLVALHALSGYLGKMAVPVSLLPYYAYPVNASLLSPEYFVSAVLAAALTVAGVFLARKLPVWSAVWWYYVITLAPVLGIIQVGNQAMADRYTYLPGLSFCLLLGVGAAWLWKKAAEPERWRSIIRPAVIVAALSAVVFLAAATYRQIAVWKSGLDLWNYVLTRDPEAGAIPYNNRGELYYKMGSFDLALADLSKAVSLSPTDPIFYNNRALAFEETGRIEEALVDYREAIDLSASNPLARYNRGILFTRIGRLADALVDFDQAILIDPFDAKLYNSRGIVHAGTGRHDLAHADFTRAIELDPGHISPYLNRGNLYRQEGRWALALQDYQKACDLGSTDGCDILPFLTGRP